jgi:trans-aconitate methyltransferase
MTNAEQPTPYDVLAYPSAIFERTHPDRMAVLATLHGLNPPPVETARVLDIGGGDGMNLIAFATAYPKAHFFGFDLAPTAVARGNEIIARSGLTNVTLEVCDIMDGAARIAPGSFDYIITHGVYAWVPEFVADALMALIGHALSPNGIAFVSYNAMPGGHIRRVMRDMLMHELAGVEGPEDRIVAARGFLEAYREAQDGDDPVVTAMREQAKAMLTRPEALIFHDEMGPCYFPKSLSDVAGAAAVGGLRVLSDAGRNRHLDGFLADDPPPGVDVEAAILRQAQSGDYIAMRFFRQSLLVKANARPLRRPDPRTFDGLWASARLTRDAAGVFHHGDDEFEVNQAGLAGRLEQLAAHWPARVSVAELAPNDDERMALLELYAGWLINLHSGPPAFALGVSEYPCVSQLARAQLAAGSDMICTLDHRQIAVAQTELRALLSAADGTRTVQDLVDLGTGMRDEDIPGALGASARQGLLIS